MTYNCAVKICGFCIRLYVWSFRCFGHLIIDYICIEFSTHYMSITTMCSAAFARQFYWQHDFSSACHLAFSHFNGYVSQATARERGKKKKTELPFDTCDLHCATDFVSHLSRQMCHTKIIRFHWNTIWLEIFADDFCPTAADFDLT